MMEKYTLEELIKRIGNSTTEVILEFLENFPKIEFSNSSIQLYIYSDSIMLVKSNFEQSLTLESKIHSDHFIEDTIIEMGDLAQLYNVSLDSLTFHQYFILKKDCCLSVITGQLNQMKNLLQYFR